MGLVQEAKRATTSWELAEGDEIAPGLSALKRLGGGTRYEAYLAWDERLHAIVVVKLVRPHLTEDAHTLAGLASEVAMVQRLAHPVVVRGYGSELAGDRPRLVLEHIEGPRVSSFVRRHGPLPPEQLIPLALQLASALHYLAVEGVVHLDVKPANIIMSGPPRLIDLSVAMDSAEAAKMRSPIGTDTYMAPEQCLPGELGPVGPPADVWGLGATLYRAASGERPFGKGDPDGTQEIRWPQLARRPEPLDPRRVPAALAGAIMSCLEPDPKDRPLPADLTDQLEPILRAQGRPRLAALKPRWN
jgi:serine/threonine protein kinase